MFDPAAGATFEVLEFRPEFATPGFEAALRERVDLFFPIAIPSLETGYTVERRKGALMLVSKQMSGRRLSELLERAHGAGFALELIRLVTPVLAAISRTGDSLSHGMLSADRIIVSRDGRLVVVEPVLGPAVATLSRSRNQLIEMGLAIPAVTPGEPIALDSRSDLTQLGFLALSLLLGRRLDRGDYPDKISGLLDEFVIHAGSPMLAARLRTWLERAMQLSQRAFATAADAEAALAELPDHLDLPGAGATGATMAAPATTVVSFKKEREKEKPAPAPETAAAAPAAAGKPIQHDAAPAAATKSAKPVVSISIGDTAPAKGEPPARKRGGWSRWVIAALVLIALGQGAVIYLQPYLRPAADVIEIRPQAIAPVPPALPPPSVNPDGTPVSAQSNQALAGGSTQPAPGGPLTSGVAPPAAGPATSPATQPAATPPANTQAASTSTAPAAPPATNQTALAGLGGAAPAPGAAARFGGLTVTSRIDLQVFEGGKALGSTAAPLALAEGTHSLELVNETLGFRHTQSVTVRGGRMLTLNIDVPKGRLSINAIPWADVDINGLAAGQTPLANVLLPIGTHQITFRHPELGTRTQTVVVKVDGSAKVTQTFKPGGDR